MLIKTTDLRIHIKSLLKSNSYSNKTLIGVDNLVSSLIANFEKNVALNKKYPNLKIIEGAEIKVDIYAWNDWCSFDVNRYPLKLPSEGLESKGQIGHVTVKTSTASKKDLIKKVHELEGLLRSIKL